MRISDWSSDVCSSDLRSATPNSQRAKLKRPMDRRGTGRRRRRVCHPTKSTGGKLAFSQGSGRPRPDRKSVVKGKRVAVCVDLGGRRVINNKQTVTTDYTPMRSTETLVANFTTI